MSPTRRPGDLGTHRFLYCVHCQLGQLSPLPTEAELQTLYTSDTYFSGGGDVVGYADYTADVPQHVRYYSPRASGRSSAAPASTSSRVHRDRNDSQCRYSVAYVPTGRYPKAT